MEVALNTNTLITDKSKKLDWKKSINNFCKYQEEISQASSDISKSKLTIVKSRKELKAIVKNFINKEIDELQEEGSFCLELCEQDGDYHMVSYWIQGTYDDVDVFLKDNYTEELGTVILSMYPNDINVLKEKISNKYGECNTKQIVYEALATILLKEMEYYPEWYTVYGTDEENGINDIIDYGCYNILNALNDKDNFPIIQSKDIVAAMYGINDTVTPSDMYDIFGYYADELKFKKEEPGLVEEKKETTFTPDPFLVAGVTARWKNYCDYIPKNKVCSDYILKFNELDSIENRTVRNATIIGSIVDDYMYRFSRTPNSLPLLDNMISISNIDDRQNTFIVTYKIRGFKNKNLIWDNIYKGIYCIPTSAEEYQQLIFKISVDFKKNLNGLEKQKYSNEEAFEGKYPNKKSASHGLNFIKDINVQYKNKRGITEKKPAIANYSLALAEKQSMYYIKKILRYSTKNPIISTSFGIDSMVTTHLLRRVAKHSFYLVNNDSLIEYPDLIQYKKKMIKQWELQDKLYITNPVKTYWTLKEENGWNFQRKGDRRGNIKGKKVSASEECCKFIKHLPMYNFIDRLISEGNPMECNFTGLKACESTARYKACKRDGIVYYAKSWKCIKVSPIAFFTDEYIWQYVRKYNMPYCKVYDMILYYDDVFDNVADEEVEKVLYRPRIGCWCCLVTTSNYYLLWLKKFYRKQYDFLMIKKGLAKDLFEIGAKKLGIIADFEIIDENKEEENTQISMFDSIGEEDSKPKITTAELLERYPIEQMENIITRRPCKFMNV